ncbi:unnamed protein product [Phytophthora fragariaefolia]|uniref:Unnamed protein product n=1 Tax=Phytophthora fragariaefolia TaxID=1490495 RepID=A0A9W6YDH1_9STRA|nr:unnamed protein product [Phytophthora fragariaefolia]
MSKDTGNPTSAPVAAPDGHLLPSLARSTDKTNPYPQQHRLRLCKELLRSRQQQIKRMEEKLEKMSEYSLKLLNERDELAAMISRKKEDVTRLAIVVGAPSDDVGYVMSYSVVLEECCNIMLYER